MELKMSELDGAPFFSIFLPIFFCSKRGDLTNYFKEFQLIKTDHTKSVEDDFLKSQNF